MEKELVKSDRELFDSFAKSGMTVGEIEGKLGITFTFKDSSLGDKKYGQYCIKKERYVKYNSDLLEEKYKIGQYNWMPKEYPCMLVTSICSEGDFDFDFIYENDFKI